MWGIVTLLSTVFGWARDVWRKHWSPEVELAKLKERQKAEADAAKKEAKRLKEDYARFKKITPTDDQIKGTLNKRL